MRFGFDLVSAISNSHVDGYVAIVRHNVAVPLSEGQIALACVSLLTPIAIWHQVHATGAAGYIEG